MRRAGFTLIELLVVVAIIALLVGVLVPTLAAARESGRGVACLAQLRSIVAICQAYADEHRGYGPAIGQPYGAFPNWAFVVSRAAGSEGATTREAMRERGVLVCPSARAVIGQDRGEPLIRTYGVNATGHNRPSFAGDPDSFDDPASPAFVRFDRVLQPSLSPWAFDTAPGPSAPAGRTASVLDFRLSDHVAQRLLRPHAQRRAVQAGFFDGSARSIVELPEWFAQPLP